MFRYKQCKTWTYKYLLACLQLAARTVLEVQLLASMILSSFGLLVGLLFSLNTSVYCQRPAIEPAATVVPEKIAAGATLLQAETVQLTDAIVKRIGDDPHTARLANLFVFDDGPAMNGSLEEEPGSCKTFPGDEDWPLDEDWGVFDRLLGGALISTVPVAAPCYNSEWGPKDLAKCNDVINRFGTPPLQYVLLIIIIAVLRIFLRLSRLKLYFCYHT